VIRWKNLFHAGLGGQARAGPAYLARDADQCCEIGNRILC
jgi:hypothetical protein